jgi:hypothetical protein
LSVERPIVRRLSHEHRALGLFAIDEFAALPMPEGYRRSVRAWAAMQEDR